MNLSKHDIILLLHALVIGPLILVQARIEKKSPSFLTNLVITVALLAIIWHSYNFIKIQVNKKKIETNK